jgi:hypothetical protein
VQVVEMAKGVLGREHPLTLASMSNLASTYTDQKRRKKAGELEVQAMEIGIRVMGWEHPDILTSVVNLGQAHGKQGQRQEGEELAGSIVCGDKKASAGRGASRHLDQHGQSRADQQEARAVEGGYGASCAGQEEKREGFP